MSRDADTRVGAETPMPVLEIGGTHVTAALVDLASGRVIPGTLKRHGLSADDPAGELLHQIVKSAAHLDVPPRAAWGVAVPGPFDYEQGVARLEGVGKFDALNGVDVGAALRRQLPGHPTKVYFLNDATAFTVGEWAFGAGTGWDRMVGITLGTGVGSGFLLRGVPVERGPEVPPSGEIHQLQFDGRPLEEIISRRAILRDYARRDPDAGGVDVREVADRAHQGDLTARLVLRRAFTRLGLVLAPWLSRFRANGLVVGGSMSLSWEVVYPSLVDGIHATEHRLPAELTVLPARNPEHAALLGSGLAGNQVERQEHLSDAGQLAGSASRSLKGVSPSRFRLPWAGPL